MKVKLLANYASPKILAQSGAIIVVDDKEAEGLIKGGYAEIAECIEVVGDIQNFDEIKEEEKKEEILEEEKHIERAVNQSILRRKKAKKL